MRRITLHFLTFFLAISTLSAILFVPLPSQAIGQVTEPISLRSAMRQTPYNEPMTIVNTENSVSTIRLSAEGDIAGWTRFYKAVTDTDNITDITLSAGSRAEIFARFIVPEGTPNGTYQGIISVARMPADYRGNKDEAGNSVTQKIDREVSIEVSDVENIEFDSSAIPETYDLSSGDILRIRIIHDNRGNVMISPQITVKIRQDGNVIYNAIFPYPDSQPQVGPYSIYEIPPLEIPTSNLGTGRYEALLAISQGDKYSIDKDFRFSIGSVLAATTTAAAPPDSGPIGSAWQALVILAILASYMMWKIRSRQTKRFEGRIDIESLTEK